MKVPLLTVQISSYNHESYIEECLEGALGQQTKYPFLVILFDDASTDKTVEVAERVQKKYPENFRIIQREKNIGGKRNFIEGFKECDSAYWCYLEGDDYWIDQLKIEQQLSFLETHKEYVGCAHNTKLFYQDGDTESQDMLSGEIAEKHEIRGFISGHSYFHTSSLIWRKVFKDQLPGMQEDERSGDWFLSMLFSEHGSVHYINKTMSVYRLHSKGVWSEKSELGRVLSNIDGMAIYDHFLNYRYEKEFTRIWWSCEDLFKREDFQKLPYFVRLKYRYLSKSIDVQANVDLSEEKRLWYRKMYFRLNKFFKGE